MPAPRLSRSCGHHPGPSRGAGSHAAVPHRPGVREPIQRPPIRTGGPRGHRAGPPRDGGGGRRRAQPGDLHLGRNRGRQSRHRGRRTCRTGPGRRHVRRRVRHRAQGDPGGGPRRLPPGRPRGDPAGGRERGVDLDALDRALAEHPAVVSVMWVNNEVGVVQPVAEIARAVPDAGVVFHTDAVQAFGKVPVSLDELSCTLLTISGHKIGAPKGIGALIVRDRKAVEAIIHGGGQQFGIRPGTENVAGAVALGCAARLAAPGAGRRSGAPRARCAMRSPSGCWRPRRTCSQRRRRRAGAAHPEHRRGRDRQRSAADALRPGGRGGIEGARRAPPERSSRRTS